MAGSTIPHIAVVILSYNTAKLTTQTVESVLQSTKVRLTVYVVDNASSDRSVMQLKRKYGLHKDSAALENLWRAVRKPGVEDRFPGVGCDSELIRTVSSERVGVHDVVLIELSENLGFGRANNIVAAATATPLVWFLNSDTTVEPNTASALASLFASNKRGGTTGIVGAPLFSLDGSPQTQGGALPTLLNIFRWMFLVDAVPLLHQITNQYQHRAETMTRLLRRGPTSVGWVGGTAMMVARTCLNEVGGFDPAIFMYAEDVDLCWRARLRHYNVILASKGRVTHYGFASGSSRSAVLGEIRGLVYLWRKHKSALSVWVLRAIMRTGLWVRILVFGILRQYGRQRIYKEALALV